MDQYTQANRLISIQTPLGEDKLLLIAFDGGEHISDLFEFHIAALSNDLALKPDSLIGKEVTVTIKGSTKKSFHGFISTFRRTVSSGARQLTHRAIRTRKCSTPASSVLSTTRI